MRAYLEFSKVAFQKNMVYRVDLLVNLLNTFILIVVNISIWKWIYNGASEVDGIEFSKVITHLTLSLILSNVFVVDEFMVANKVSTGAIVTDVLKPISFYWYIFFHNLGNLLFKLILLLAPSIILTAVIYGMLPPHSFVLFLIFLISITLGYFIVFNIGFITSMISFWYFNIWSFTTLKNVLISVLSGVFLPLWFLPQGLVDFIKITPFESIYQIPINIYLGVISTEEILMSLIKQTAWVLLLAVASMGIWRAAQRKLVIQGG